MASNLHSFTVKQLHEYCVMHGIEGHYSRKIKNKADLVAHIEAQNLPDNYNTTEAQDDVHGHAEADYLASTCCVEELPDGTVIPDEEDQIADAQDQYEQEEDTREEQVLDWLIAKRDEREEECFQLDGILDEYADSHYTAQDEARQEGVPASTCNFVDLLCSYSGWGTYYCTVSDSWLITMDSIHQVKSFARKLRKRFGFNSVNREDGSLTITFSPSNVQQTVAA